MLQRGEVGNSLRGFLSAVFVGKTCFLIIALSVFINGHAAQTAALTEDQKIEGLVSAIKESHAIFIRNGTEHTSYEAVQHLRKKLDYARSSWFSNKKSNWTARMFIEKIASQSSMSGQPYLVKFPDGKTIETRIWLLEKLKSIEATEPLR